MIRMMAQYAHCAIDLLRQHDARQRMRQREARKGQGHVASLQNLSREPVGAAYEEREVAPVAHPPAEPVGKLACAHLRTALIQRHDPFLGTEGGHQFAGFRLDGLAWALSGTAWTGLDLE